MISFDIQYCKYMNEVRTDRAGSGASGSQRLNILTGFSLSMEAEHQQQTKQTASNQEALPTTKSTVLCRFCLCNFQKKMTNLTPKTSKSILQVARKLM